MVIIEHTPFIHAVDPLYAHVYEDLCWAKSTVIVSEALFSEPVVSSCGAENDPNHCMSA